MTTASLDLVPARRVGILLRDAREERGLTLADVADGSGLDEDLLADLESGATPIRDSIVDDVLRGYRTTVDELPPSRRQVVVDRANGQLLVAEETALLDEAPTADEVLGAYLSLVYSLRHATPGTRLVLRDHDVAVLATALHLAEPEVQTRLAGLMEHPTDEVGRLTKLLRSRFALPVAGVVVLATALGTVLVLRDDGRSTPPPTGVTQTSVPEAELIEPAVQERNLDGSSGPVEEVGP